MNPNKQDAANRRIALEAADWLLQVETDASPESRAAFAAWLRHSPQHMEEFLMVSATAGALRGMDAGSEIDVDALLRGSGANVVDLQASAASASVPADMARPPRHGRRRALTAAGLAAGLAALALLVSMIHDQFNGYRTALGEQRSLQMEDGSMLHLNTRSRVEVDYSRRARDIVLLDGEALFVVAPDPARPFRVIAGAAVIQAVGTQFNVYRKSGRTTVSVVEGRVRVGTAPVLAAGEQIELADDGRVLSRSTADIAAAVAWRQLRLVFRAQRLDAVAAEFNRYNRLAIEVEGAAAGLRMTGTFNANEPEGFLSFLQRDRNLDIRKRDGKVIVRARPAG